MRQVVQLHWKAHLEAIHLQLLLALLPQQVSKFDCKAAQVYLLLVVVHLEH